VSKPLSGWTVVITRPAGRGVRLVRAVEAAGGKVLRLPTLVIEASPDEEPSLAHLEHINRFDRVIFTSVPAVQHALALQPKGWPMPVWAVGRRTQKELEAGGVQARIPQSGANTEALLAEADLETVAGLRLAIVCAPGGRPLLADSLRQRGAEVTEIYVYRRRLSDPDPDKLTALRQDYYRSILTVTSQQILNGLLKLDQEPGQALTDRPLVVNAERVGELARKLGFTRVVCAGGASVEDMLAALIQALEPEP
jgi:uroporphyrinogen-III synthase